MDTEAMSAPFSITLTALPSAASEGIPPAAVGAAPDAASQGPLPNTHHVMG